MSTRKSTPTSSSSSAKRATMSENPTKRVTAVKPQLAKKRPALSNITNKRNGPQSGARNSISSSKPMMPCVVKIAKKKESSTCTHDAELSGNTLPAFQSVNAGALVHSNHAFTPRSDKPTARGSAISASSITDIVVPVLSSMVPASRIVDLSPSRSVSLDDTMSTSDSLKSPEFEYVDNEDASADKSIERRTCTSLYTENTCKRDLLLEMEKIDRVVDVDSNFADPQLCASIACDIYKHLRASEVMKMPSPDFMERIQRDINAGMRAILIDWLVEVAEEYRLVPDTLFLTINCIDRYLSGNVMNRQRLQLLGVACMMIAAKYEEIYAPKVEDFCYITDNTFSKEEVLQMESAVLNYLKFEMTTPTAKCFLRRFVRAAINEIPSIQLECLANYLAELSLLDYNMLRYAPSLIAASATFLAKYILFPLRKPWNFTLRHYSLYQPSDLCDCVKALHRLCCNSDNSNLPAIREKYSQHKYKFVAKKYCPPSIPLDFFQDLCK